jgi:hypothetical protein
MTPERGTTMSDDFGIRMTHSCPVNTTFTFHNGWKVSMTIGSGAYAHGKDEAINKVDGRIVQHTHESTSAEIAVIRPDGEFHQIKGQIDEVVGWVSPERIIEVAYWVSMGDMDAVAKVFE